MTKFNRFDNEQEEMRGAEDGVLESMRASAITITAIEWLWLNRFALGKVGIIAGLPDMGKGQMLAYIAAQATREDREGPVSKAEIDEAARAHCISNASLRRAQKLLEIETWKDNTNPKGGWFWRLKEQPKSKSYWS